MLAVPHPGPTSAPLRMLLILQNNIEGVDNAGDVTKNGQQNVDKKIRAAAALEKDTQRREDDGEEDFEDVGCSEDHCEGLGCGFGVLCVRLDG